MNLKPLSSIEFAARLKEAGDLEFQVGGVNGLAFRRFGGGASWVLRFTENGKRKKVGIGAFSKYPTLKSARERAAEFIAARQNGQDIREPRISGDLSIESLVLKCVDEFRENHHYKDQKEYKRLLGRISKYALPFIGKLSPYEVQPRHIASVYKSAVSSDGNTSTADKTRDALQLFFDWCVGKGYFPNNQRLPTEKKLLKSMIPKSTKGKSHMKAIPFSEMPRLFCALTEPESFLLISSMAIAFEILTCCRQHMICGNEDSTGDKPLTWGDIADDFSTIKINAEALKKSENGDAVIPLSSQAQRILMRAIELNISDSKDPNAPVFTGQSDNPITEAALNKRLRVLDDADIKNGGRGFRDPKYPDRAATMHGTVRAGFNTWAAENRIAQEVIDMCLFHSVDRYQGAYNRSERIEERREVLQKWADYCFSACQKEWDAIP